MTNFMPRAQSCGFAFVLIERTANLTHGAIANDGELGAHIHAGHEAIGWAAKLVHTLVGEPQAGDRFAFAEWRS